MIRGRKHLMMAARRSMSSTWFSGQAWKRRLVNQTSQRTRSTSRSGPCRHLSVPVSAVL